MILFTILTRDWKKLGNIKKIPHLTAWKIFQSHFYKIFDAYFWQIKHISMFKLEFKVLEYNMIIGVT